MTRPDPYRASWLGITTVVAACMTLPVAVVACQRGTDAGLHAAAFWYGLGAVGVGLPRLWALVVNRQRTLRHRHDRCRGVAFSDRPPGPAQLADDYAASVVRFPYPPDTED